MPMLLGMVMFTWGALLFFRIYDAPADALEIFVVAKQWMWHLQHSEGPLGDQRAACPARPAGQAEHDLARRDPQLLRPGLPGQAGRACRAATRRSGSSRHGRPLSPLLRRVLRHEPFDDGGLGHGDGAGRLSALAVARRARAVDGRGRRAALRPAPLRRLPSGQPDRARHRGSRASSAGRSRSRRARTSSSSPPTQLHPRLDLVPKAQVVAGYEPVMPSFKDQISEPDLLKIIAYIKSIGTEGATR